jgi:hypothetical protein
MTSNDPIDLFSNRRRQVVEANIDALVNDRLMGFDDDWDEEESTSRTVRDTLYISLLNQPNFFILALDSNLSTFACFNNPPPRSMTVF